MTISKKITTCYEYVDLAEMAAYNGAYEDSNRYWKNAANLAISLLQNNDHGTFLDEEYDFLVRLAKQFKDLDNEKFD